MKKHICEPTLVNTRKDGMPYECMECGKGFKEPIETKYNCVSSKPFEKKPH